MSEGKELTQDAKEQLDESIENGWAQVDEIEVEDVGLPDNKVKKEVADEVDPKLDVAFVDQEVFGRQ